MSAMQELVRVGDICAGGGDEAVKTQVDAAVGAYRATLE